MTSGLVSHQETPHFSRKVMPLQLYGGFKVSQPYQYTQMIHVWNIYLHDWVIYGVNGGKYTIHGSSGIDISTINHLVKKMKWNVHHKELSDLARRHHRLLFTTSYGQVIVMVVLPSAVSHRRGAWSPHCTGPKWPDRLGWAWGSRPQPSGNSDPPETPKARYTGSVGEKPWGDGENLWRPSMVNQNEWRSNAFILWLEDGAA